ncbi:MAG: hypothetical protein WC787_03935 [Patescibacteria group bacterium]|jgi:hypothetical protein
MDRVPFLRTLSERWNILAKEQKISAGILAVCGLIAMGLSVERLSASIRDPFTVSRETFDSAKRTLDKIDPSKRLEDESRRRDTDGDGLSDYDEENLFQTSPYLADTDGDGSPDNVELALGQNPNCGAGETCASALIDVSGLASSSSPFLFGQQPNSADSFYAAFQRGVNASKASIASESGSTSTNLEQGLVRDANEIRKVLLESGKVDAKLLEKITDAQLLELYDNAVAEAAKKKVESETGITDPSKYPSVDPSPSF